jgi:hypothetical protein
MRRGIKFSVGDLRAGNPDLYLAPHDIRRMYVQLSVMMAVSNVEGHRLGAGVACPSQSNLDCELKNDFTRMCRGLDQS